MEDGWVGGWADELINYSGRLRRASGVNMSTLGLV